MAINASRKRTANASGSERANKTNRCAPKDIQSILDRLQSTLDPEDGNGSASCSLLAVCEVNKSTTKRVPSSRSADNGSASALLCDPVSQTVHEPRLLLHQEVFASEAYLTVDEQCPVKHGRSAEYHQWWLSQLTDQSDLSVLSAQLIGDSSAPHLYTSLPLHDLAFCR